MISYIPSLCIYIDIILVQYVRKLLWISLWEVFYEAICYDACTKKGKDILLHLGRAYLFTSTCFIDDMNNLTTRPCSLPATLPLTPLNALAQHGSTAATVCSPARS